MKTPRYYQADALKSINDWFYDGKKGNPICVMATGCGKALVIAEYIRMALEFDPGVRAICAIDTKELVQQNYDTFLDQMPFGPAGIYSSGLRRRDAKAQVLFCGIQSVYDKAADIGKADILLIDECHCCSTNEEGMWRTFINDLLTINPYMIIIGFTATPYRMDSGFLWTPYNDVEPIFNGVCYDYTIKQGIADGYLSNIIPKSMDTKLKTDGVGKRGGDFIEGQLQRAINKEEITKACIDEIEEYGKTRKAWLVFGTGIAHCEDICAEMRSRGINCEIVLGTTPNKERDDIIKRFKAGEIKCLVNNAVLTKGFDAPFVDLVAAMRPTMSPVLWLQMVGRGFRIAEGKENCLLLDFACNVERFGLIDEVTFKDKIEKGKGVSPMKECPECSTIVAAATRFCPECGTEFEIEEEIKIKPKSHDRAVLSTQRIIEEWQVTDILFFKHTRKTPHSLRIDYYCGINKVSEWICFEHEGFARTKAVQWWQSNTSGDKLTSLENAELYIAGVPKTVDDALKLSETIKRPAAIQVVQEGRFFKIVGRSYEEFSEAGEDHPLLCQQQEDDFEIPVF